MLICDTHKILKTKINIKCLFLEYFLQVHNIWPPSGVESIADDKIGQKDQATRLTVVISR